MYHERQVRMLCGIHAVNNFLQRTVYTKEIFDEISKRMFAESPEKDMYTFNPHKRAFWGNYDANIVIEALRLEGYATEWFPKTKPDANLSALFWEDDVKGIIINKPAFFGRHWTCLRKNDGEERGATYHDSKCPKPEVLDNEVKVNDFIQDTLANEKDNEYFIVRLNNNDDNGQMNE